MKISTFLNRPDTDDTLQNIRKEYLNTKRNLKELLTNSPTKITQDSRMAMDLKSKVPIQAQFGVQQQDLNQVPIHPQQHHKQVQDEQLRKQLREYMADRNVGIGTFKGDQSMGPPNLATEVRYQNDPGFQIQLDNQRTMINSLRRELERQASLNNILFNRLERLEEEFLTARHSNQRQQTNAGNCRSVYSAPSSSHTNNGALSHASTDDTRILLNWDQQAQIPNQFNKASKHGRSFSNPDDNTTRLIQLSSHFKFKS